LTGFKVEIAIVIDFPNRDIFSSFS
jgi:hypothetical protein